MCEHEVDYTPDDWPIPDLTTSDGEPWEPVMTITWDDLALCGGL